MERAVLRGTLVLVLPPWFIAMGTAEDGHGTAFRRRLPLISAGCLNACRSGAGVTVAS